MENSMLKLQTTAMSLAVCSLFFSAFAARTFSISEQTDTSVTFRFETPDGFDYSIYLASGATDADDDKYGWDAFAKIGDVRRDDTSLTYEVPAELRDGRCLQPGCERAVVLPCDGGQRLRKGDEDHERSV